ncbi:Formate--tetrahydrofolate ligase [Nymphon striatum]|nr:Formate--tetrahydrofolate ligase [Nymphon striatum]
MTIKTDIEIAREANKKPIQDIGAKLDIPSSDLLPFGHDKAKVSEGFIKSVQGNKDGKLILVTAINPTPAGEGKTTTTVGLGDGLNSIGKKAAICIREASLGPCFGMKGGAAGGGYAQVPSLGGVANGFPREAGFDITVASEVMAILCLSNDLDDLKERLGNIIVAYRRDRSAVYARDIKADGAMTPALVADLGAEKFMNIKCRKAGLAPEAVVIVATVRAMKMNGGVAKADLGAENVDAVNAGCSNLGRHIANMKKFGVPAVVAINHFVTDTDAEVEAVKAYVATQGAEAILCKHWAHGSKGTQELAHKVVEIIEGGGAQYAPLYPDDMGLFGKIETIAKEIYRADEVLADKKIRDQLKQWEEAGYGNLPVCMAKTQYSFSTDPNLRGAPTGHSLPIREVRLSAGAGFVVAICGEIMTMPGLPRTPSAEAIMLDENGDVQGLF